MAYAANTSVPVERSKAEIERVLKKAGATSFQSGWSSEFASVGFTLHGVQILIGLPLPDLKEYAKRRSKSSAEAAYQQETRRRWRCLLLIVKAKLEYVGAGLSTLEQEFLANVLLPNGRTLGEWAVPQVRAIQAGSLLLPEHAESSR